MRTFRNVMSTIGLMLVLLFAVGLLGGVGTVELAGWTVLLGVALVVVVVRSRRRVGG